MINPYYTRVFDVTPGNKVLSQGIEDEFARVQYAFDLVTVSPAFTGTPTAPTAAAGTSTTQIATTAFVAATAFSAALPAQTGNAGKFVTTDGTNASWSNVGLTVTPVTGTTQTAVAGKQYILSNVAATAVTMPTTLTAGDQIAISPNNGLYTNTVDFGAKTVRGPAGTATGVVTLNAGATMSVVAIDTNTWMMI